MHMQRQHGCSVWLQWQRPKPKRSPQPPCTPSPRLPLASAEGAQLPCCQLRRHLVGGWSPAHHCLCRYARRAGRHHHHHEHDAAAGRSGAGQRTCHHSSGGFSCCVLAAQAWASTVRIIYAVPPAAAPLPQHVAGSAGTAARRLAVDVPCLDSGEGGLKCSGPECCWRWHGTRPRFNQSGRVQDKGKAASPSVASSVCVCGGGGNWWPAGFAGASDGVQVRVCSLLCRRQLPLAAK